MKTTTVKEIKSFVPMTWKDSKIPRLETSFINWKVATPIKAENVLTDSDLEIYGDREPSGYKKISLLGKGGAAVVWLGKHISTGEKVALK